MPRPRATGARSRPRREPGRPKIDPRFALLLSLPVVSLTKLKDDEDARIRKVDENVRELLDRQADEEQIEEDVRTAFESIESALFTPLTTGIYVLPGRQEPRVSPLRMRQPYASVFVLCDGSAEDLRPARRARPGSSRGRVHGVRPARPRNCARRGLVDPRNRARSSPLHVAQPGDPVRTDQDPPNCDAADHG